MKKDLGMTPCQKVVIQEDPKNMSIRQSVDSLCRDDADMPMPPYIGKLATAPTLHLLAFYAADCDPRVFLYLKTPIK